MKLRDLKPIFVEDSKVPVWISKLPFVPININAIAIGFIVFARGKLSAKTKLHETIHLQQYIDTLFLGYIILYFYDYFKGFLKYHDGELAYRRIRAEQEAYLWEKQPNYLHYRRRWEWIRKFTV